MRYECATAYCAMFYLLKGIPFLYQGQEWGTPDPHYDSIEDFCDVETINYYNEHKGESDILDKLNFGSRDNARRPLCWTNGKNFGFSNGEHTWARLHSRGSEVNLEADKKSEKSVFAFYQRVLAFRREREAIRYGSFEDCTKGEGYFAYKRKYHGEEILVVVNFDKTAEIDGLPDYAYLFGNGSERSVNGSYAPFEAAIYKKQ